MINLLRKRRTIRKFKTNRVGPDMISQLKEALLRAPSSRDLKPWEFIFVTDSTINEKLACSKPHGADFLKNAPLGIVICADEDRSDVWIEDCAIAAITAQYTAESMGLGACWIQIRNRMHNDRETAEEYIKRILPFPGHIRILAIMAIGYPAEQKKARPEPREYHKITTI